MLGIHDYWFFLATGVLLNLTPGQDTFFILGQSLSRGVRAGVASAFGIAAGCLVHTAMAAIGLSALLAASAAAFVFVKLAGAAYLVYLGVRMIGAPGARLALDRAVSGDVRSRWSAFRDGLITNVLNPKVALFFLALMPQFIDPTSDAKVLAFLALGLTFITTGTIWCLVLAFSAGGLRRFFEGRPAGLDLVSRAAGGLFVLLGLRLAVSRQ
jgi:threonine/homoserine/homoserine lactone efflux protein